MKKLISVILSVVMIMTMFMPVLQADGEDVKVFVDGVELNFDVPPVIENDRVLVPVRAIAEALNKTVDWDEQAQAVIISDNGDYWVWPLWLTIGSSTMWISEVQIFDKITPAPDMGINQRSIDLDVPARIIKNRTFIPLRAVSEAFGVEVQWDADTRTVILTTGAAATEAPAATPEQTQEPVTVDTSFAFRLKEQMPTDKNYMVSPFSIKVALAMVANAAEGITKTEMLDTLDIGDLDEFNEYVKAFIEENNSAKKANSGEVETNAQKLPEFEIANSIWFNEDYYRTYYNGPFGSHVKNVKFSPEFRETVADYYDGASEIVNNKNAVNTINGWISEKTRGKITGVLESPEFLASIVNAIYMKAQWSQPFDEELTQKDTFTYRDGKKTEIDFMNDTSRRLYYSDDDTQMVCLPYYGGFSMYVVLGDSSDFETERQKMGGAKVHVKLPKWKTENTFELNGILNTLGIETAFDKRHSNLDKMMINQPEYDVTYIDKVTHKTFIEVDENKTEAAAVTVVHIGASATALYQPTPEPIIPFIADEPFTYFICDDKNGEILFMGEYAFAE